MNRLGEVLVVVAGGSKHLRVQPPRLQWLLQWCQRRSPGRTEMRQFSHWAPVDVFRQCGVDLCELDAAVSGGCYFDKHKLLVWFYENRPEDRDLALSLLLQMEKT